MTTSNDSNEDRAAQLQAGVLGPEGAYGSAPDARTGAPGAGEPMEQLLRVVGDAPVELVVELARFEMPLSELAALRPGEVLGTGRAIGERVVLRAGDRTIAHGELVDIEGEIGVRLISLEGAHS